MTDPDVIATGIEKGVRKSRLKLTDRRVVFLAVFVVAFVLLTTVWQQHQTDQVRQQNEKIVKAQQAAYLVCLQTDVGNAKFNKVLDQLITNIRVSKTLTAQQKAQALDAYASLHLTITDCSKLAGR